MFAKAILVGAFAALAAAQSSVLTFTRVPNPVTAGSAQAITYATNDTSLPVTIILRQGESDHLKNISTLTTDATGGQFIWTPSTSLPDGSDYALQIEQGTQTNYFGPFTLQGGGLSSSSSSMSATITSMASSTSLTASMGTGISMSRNTTMSSATLTAPTSAQTTGPSATDNGAGFQTTSATASPTNAASGLAHGSSAVALVFGAIAAILYC